MRFQRQVAVLFALFAHTQALRRTEDKNHGAVTSPPELEKLLGFSPRQLDLNGSSAAAASCEKLAQLPGQSWSLTNSFKEAMRAEGGIDGTIAALDKYGDDLTVAFVCLGALDKAIFYHEKNQHYAGSLGAQRVLVKVLRSHINNRDFIERTIGEVGGLMDFCVECGEQMQQNGGDELMLEIMNKYIDDAGVVQNTLNGLTGNVYHSSTSRDNLAKLGLLDILKDLLHRYPYGPHQWLQIRQEVFAVTTGLALPATNQEKTRDAIVMSGFPEEVLKLIREQPTDTPSLAKSCEFIRSFASYDKRYAELLVSLGAAEHIVWAMGNYSTPTGEYAQYAGKFWNVDQSGSSALHALAASSSAAISRMVDAGAIPQLIKALYNPEGGYQLESYAAREPACGVLKYLSDRGDVARAAKTGIPQECLSLAR